MTSIFLTKDAPKVNVDNNAQPIRVGADAGPPITLSDTYDVALSSTLFSDFLNKGHVMKEFHENLVDIGPMCDAK